MSTSNTKSPLHAPSHILALLDRLHALSVAQEPETNQAISSVLELRKTDPTVGTAALNKLMSDKFVALDRDKCEFVYQLILSTGAKNVVEAGTSFGVSTIYLALAVGQNSPEDGKVIATELDSEKARRAKQYWQEAGEDVTKYVELREGDLLETLQRDLPVVDLLLLDIWTPLALPTLKLVQPQMRRGAVVVADNTVSAGPLYEEFLLYVNDPEGPFRSLTMPYEGGLEMSVFLP